MIESRIQKTRIVGQKGFTLIEVMLYLAVVGLVIMIGFNAVAGRTSQVQFSDSMRDLHGYVTAQYSEFVSGVKPYEDLGCVYEEGEDTPDFTEPSDGSCILFGKVFIFETEFHGDPTVVKTYNLVGKNLSDDPVDDYGSDDCNSADLRCVKPAVIELTDSAQKEPETHQILWGAEFIKGNEWTHLTFGNDGYPQDLNGWNRKSDNVRGFGWVKEPVLNQLIPIVFGSDNPERTTSNINPFVSTDMKNQNIYLSHRKASEGDSPSPKVAMGEEVASGFCFRGPGGDMAMITIGDDESQEVVSLKFGEVSKNHVCTL